MKLDLLLVTLALCITLALTNDIAETPEECHEACHSYHMWGYNCIRLEQCFKKTDSAEHDRCINDCLSHHSECLGVCAVHHNDIMGECESQCSSKSWYEMDFYCEDECYQEELNKVFTKDLPEQNVPISQNLPFFDSNEHAEEGVEKRDMDWTWESDSSSEDWNDVFGGSKRKVDRNLEQN